MVSFTKDELRKHSTRSEFYLTSKTQGANGHTQLRGTISGKTSLLWRSLDLNQRRGSRFKIPRQCGL
ncbi:hypothetical protein CR513_16409, partial [Mucuna pruriens]